MSKAQDWKRREIADAPTGPLQGLKVLDMSRLVAGNMASLQLADFGADVVKVEALPAGDPLRAWRQGARRRSGKPMAATNALSGWISGPMGRLICCAT